MVDHQYEEYTDPDVLLAHLRTHHRNLFLCGPGWKPRADSSSAREQHRLLFASWWHVVDHFDNWEHPAALGLERQMEELPNE